MFLPGCLRHLARTIGLNKQALIVILLELVLGRMTSSIATGLALVFLTRSEAAMPRFRAAFPALAEANPNSHCFNRL